MAGHLFVIDLDPSNPVSDEDIETILHPDPFEVVIRVTNVHDASMEALAARSGVFPSRGQARKNGFSGPIPHGFALWGTDAGNFFVWNPHPPTESPTISRKRDLTRSWWNYLDAMRATGFRGSWSVPTDLETCRAEWQRRRAAGVLEEPFHDTSEIT